MPSFVNWWEIPPGTAYSLVSQAKVSHWQHNFLCQAKQGGTYKLNQHGWRGGGVGIQEYIKDPSMLWWNCCVRACLALSSRVNMTFITACKPNLQWLLPIPLFNRLDWSSSSTMWLWPLKISINYISTYSGDLSFLLHFAQMQSALKAENAASSHVLWHLSSWIMMAFGSHLSSFSIGLSQHPALTAAL